MKPSLAYISGLALMSAAVIGILFSAGGLILLSVYNSRTSETLMNSLDGLSNALTVTGDGLDIAHSAVMETGSTLDSLAVTIDTVNTSMSGSKPSLQAVSDLLGTELPNTIIATQDSLKAAETSAKNIDGLLTGLSKLPFLGSLVYNPRIPLNETIAGISDSLDEIPRDLQNTQEGLDLIIDTMDEIYAELGSITESTAQIHSSTDEALNVIEDYQTMVDDLQTNVDQLKDTLPRTMRWLTAAAVLFLIWLGLAQIGLLLQANELLKRSKESLTTNLIEDASE